MATPDIRIFYWGKRDGEWNWWQAGYRLNGVDKAPIGGAAGDHFPIAIPGPSGDYSKPSIVSDSVFSGTAPFAAVPIAIVNVGSGTLEECNFEAISHYWAGGNADSGGGFSNTWWNKNSAYFGTAPSFQSSNGFTSYSNLNQNLQNVDDGLWYREGLRVPAPSGNTLPDSEDASTSKWNVQTSDIYDAQHVGFGPLRNAHGDFTLNEEQRLQVLDPANRKSILGFDGSNMGFYSENRDSAGYTGEEKCLDVFLRRTAGAWTADEANVWRMAHVWSTSRSSNRKTTPFGDYTCKVIHPDSRYWLTNTNSDIMQPGRVIKGYVWCSVYDKDQTFTSATDNVPAKISGGTGLEGAVFGRFFFTMSVFGRYYS